MATNSVLPPFPIFPGSDGQPLENGFIYIGVAGFEARTTPKASYFDTAMAIPTGTASGAAIRTMGGFPVRNGSPAMFYVDGDFSITVTDRNGVVVYSALNTTLALNVGGEIGPVLGPDGSLGAVGIGFENEPNTGFVRSAAGTMQTAIAGVLVSQQTVDGTVFQQPVSGAGFTSGVLTVAQPIGATLTSLEGLPLVAGDTLYATAADTLARLPIGANGTTLGVSGGVPVWVGAGRVLLASKTASASATLDFTEFNNAVYSQYEFELDSVKPANDGVDLGLRFSTNAGSSYDSGASDYPWQMNRVTGGTNAGGGSASNFLPVSFTNAMGNAAAEHGVSGRVTMYNAGTATVYTRVLFDTSLEGTSSELVHYTGTGRRSIVQDTDAVRFLMNAGNIASGRIRMYGIV